MKFQFLKENYNKYNIKKACKILNVSRSGFYSYLTRRKSKRAIANETLYEMIEEVFNENKGRYGSRRIKLVLEQQNIIANVRRISKLMVTHGLVAKALVKLINIILIKLDMMKKIIS